MYLRIGPLLAGMLGVALTSALQAGWAQDAHKVPADKEIRDEVVVSARKLSDEALAAKVTTAVEQDPYIFSNHLTVTAENGIVRLEGRLSDRHDLLRLLRLARRIAGKGRVENDIEFAPSDDDSEH